MTLARAYFIAAVVLGLVLLAASAPDLLSAFRRTPWDLNVDHLSARAYLSHYSPFTPEGARRSGVAIAGPSGLGHPPTTSFWALPLASLEIHTAGRVLGGITILLILTELIVIMRLLHFPAPLATGWLAMAYIVSCSFMNYHFGVGQISGLIAFLIFVSWWAGRIGKDWVAGIALGAACTLKLFPAVVLILFVVTRRWRAVGAAVAVYLAIAAIMTARFGLDSWTRFFSVQRTVADQWMGNIQNQSIHGVISRLFEPVCTPHGPVVRKAMIISTVLSVVLLSLASLAVWRSRRNRNVFDLSFALFSTLAVTMSQWVWEHYTVIYVLPVLVLIAELRQRWNTGRARTATAAMMLLLIGVVASWRINVHVKQDLQRAVQGGRAGLHFQLHVFDILNWAPGLVLLGLLFIVYLYNPGAGMEPTSDTDPPHWRTTQ